MEYFGNDSSSPINGEVFIAKKPFKRLAPDSTPNEIFAAKRPAQFIQNGEEFTTGYLDHCFLDEQMRHCVDKSQVLSNVKVVPYQRFDSSTSYTFEASSVVEKLLRNVLILIRLLTEKSRDHSRETIMCLIRGLQDDLTELVDIRNKSIKPKGLESLAVANINDEIINAGITVVKNIRHW